MEQSCRGISESGGLGFIAAIGSTTVPQGGNEASRLCLGGCVTIPRSQECNFILNFWLNLYPVSKCKYHWFPLLISQGSCTLTRTTTSNLEGLAVILATTRLLEVQMLDNEPARLRSYVTEQYSQANPLEQTWSYVLLYSTKNEVGRRAANDVSRKRVALPLNVVRSERMIIQDIHPGLLCPTLQLTPVFAFYAWTFLLQLHRSLTSVHLASQSWGCGSLSGRLMLPQGSDHAIV